MRRTLTQAVVAVMLVAIGIHIGASASGSGAWAAASGNAAPARGEPRAREVEETERWVVEFDARADLRGADKIKDKRERGRFVRDRLVATAERSQGEARRAAAARGAQADSHWLRNVMIVEDADRQLVAELRQLPGVREVRPERAYPLVQPVPMDAAILEALGDPDWGAERIGAPAAWEEGILGGGVVVANIDTGVDFTHPALVNQYRGNLGGAGFVHDYNWWDPTGLCGPIPCDTDGHGTHTMGTMVGGDGPGPFVPDIGVAPGAQWIAAKGCEFFFCTEGSLLSSGEFMIAPTDLDGDNPDPGRAPHIVNNSWGGGPGDEFYLEIVQGWRAAGIIPVFSAGNPGPSCGNGGSPGDYNESFSVGATDIDDVIAGFSGRGPSAFGKVNPDVAAPGVNVLSSVPGDDYEAFSGTSMAAPHVAGALALMLSAQPDLIGNVDDATDFLRDTALAIPDLSCGGHESGVPNNVYGHGRIDAFAAVDLVKTGGTLVGMITDAATGSPIGGARITAIGPQRTSTTFTKDDGSYRLFLAAGTYVVTAGAFGYGVETAVDVPIVTDETTALDLALTALTRLTVRGIVASAENGSPIAGATVRAVGTPLAPVTTDRQGRYRITLPQGSHVLEASKGGCMQRAQTEVDVLANLTQNLAIARKLDRFGHGCDPIRFQWTNTKDQTALYGLDVYGRLRLPFSFPFYGERYNAVFVDSNGYLTLEDHFFSEFFNTAIPNPATPNAAIYALWQDLWVDEEAEVDYALSGTTAEIDRWRQAGQSCFTRLLMKLPSPTATILDKVIPILDFLYLLAPRPGEARQ
jgi:subtilisin family serine protease